MSLYIYSWPIVYSPLNIQMIFRKYKWDHVLLLSTTLKCFPSSGRKFSLLSGQLGLPRFGPFSDLISYPHLSFPLCSSNTGVPIPWTCQTYFLLRTFAHALPFFFFDSLMSDVSMAWSVSSSRCLLRRDFSWLPFLEHKITLMATWYYSVCLFEMSSIKMEAPCRVRGFISLTQCF